MKRMKCFAILAAACSMLSACGRAEGLKSTAAEDKITTISIEEAQRDKKLIAISAENGVHFLYNNVLYGIPEWESIADDITCLENNAIQQIEGRTDDIIFLDEKGRVTVSDIKASFQIDFYSDERSNVVFESEGEKDNISLGEAKYVYYKTGSQGNRDIYALLKDGRCLIQNDDSWSNIQEIYMGEDVLSMEYLGREKEERSVLALLKEDGTVEIELVKTPEEFLSVWNGMDISTWSGIKCIAAGKNWLAGLKADGSLAATGKGYPKDIFTWKDIVDIQYVSQFTGADLNEGIIGLKNDGTLISSKNLENVDEEIQEWKNIKMMDCRGDNIVAVSNDGYLYRTMSDGYTYFAFDIVYEYMDGEYIKKDVETADISEERVISLKY